MTHLTAEQRQALASALKVRQQALEARLQTHQLGLSRVDYASELLAQDDDNAPQRASERELDLALSDIELQELAAINRAQQRVHESDYGLCVDCGCAIPLQRLQIEPEALRCVDCQARLESKH